LRVLSSTLVARHPWATVGAIADRTGFAHRVAEPLPITPPPGRQYLDAIRAIDAAGLRERLIG